MVSDCAMQRLLRRLGPRYPAPSGNSEVSVDFLELQDGKKVSRICKYGRFQGL